MNKGQLIDAAAAKTGLTKNDTKKTLEAILESIQESLKKNDPVQLIGFGTFKVTSRKAREGRNPRTGEVIKIKACKVPSFSAGQAFKDELN